MALCHWSAASLSKRTHLLTRIRRCFVPLGLLSSVPGGVVSAGPAVAKVSQGAGLRQLGHRTHAGVFPPPSFHSFPLAKHVLLPANGKSGCSHPDNGLSVSSTAASHCVRARLRRLINPFKQVRLSAASTSCWCSAIDGRVTRGRSLCRLKMEAASRIVT